MSADNQNDYAFVADDEQGLRSYLRTGFSSSMKWVMVVGYIYAFVFTLLMFTFGYHFFTAEPERQLFWGVLLILVFNALVAVKLWIFIETNRNHMSRALKRLELRLGATPTE